MSLLRSTVNCFVTLILPFIASSCDLGGTPEITVSDVRITPSEVFSGVASAFMVISNHGTGSDILKGCSVKEFPSVQGVFHDVLDGRMRRQDRVHIPASTTTALVTGGRHLMFSGFPEEPGDAVTIILDFRKSGSIEVAAAVERSLSAGAGHRSGLSNGHD